jgi:hypothetical protein
MSSTISCGSPTASRWDAYRDPVGDRIGTRGLERLTGAPAAFHRRRRFGADADDARRGGVRLEPGRDATEQCPVA